MTKILLTGGCGFLGKTIIDELYSPGSPVTPSLLRILDIAKPHGPAREGIGYVQGDIRDYSTVLGACRGMDVVIHTAAVVDWGTKSAEEVISVNTGGTENIIRACREQKVKCLVYTSSLDAIFGGKPLVDIDETIPYPARHPNSYCTSKYLSEKLVLAANDGSLKTVVLRPADIYGESDPFHIGSLITMAKGGFYVRLGNGRAKSQHVYVGNIAWAHLLAAASLLDNNSAVPGNVYFITDSPGSNFFHFFDRIVEAIGYRIRPKNFWIPRRIAMAIGFLSETMAVLARPVKKYTPKMSRFAVTYTCTDFTFSAGKAGRDFGFVPKYGEEEAFRRTVEFYKEKK
jgi:nucleoside-diphosphate-sugar epimerase